MTILGVAESVAASLVRAVAEAPDRDAVAERFARAAWSRVAEPGDGDAGRLVASLGAERALDAVMREADRDDGTAPVLGDEYAAAVARWRSRLGMPELLLALRQAARFGASLVIPSDPDWPTRLDDLGDNTPHALWVRGDRTVLGRLERSIAIVGARAATGYGEHVTVEAAAGLVDRGFAVISGAAYGIDGVAHRAALASGGDTVAFLAGGVDRFYPAGHEQLLGRIVERGAVVSEVPCGVAPSRWRFLQRNRLIAATAGATVVVEAGWRSGSLNTAHHALDLGRPVGVVPGPVTSSASAGCHRLLREAPVVCVTGAAEMAELVPGAASERSWPEAPVDDRMSGTRTRLIDALSQRTARTPAALAAISGLAPDRIRAELGLLELEGAVRERPTGWVRARGSDTGPG